MPNQKLLRILLQMLFAEKRVDDSLVQIWKLKFGHIVKSLFRRSAQGRVILKIKFGRNADIWLRFSSWCLVEILKINLTKICVI